MSPYYRFAGGLALMLTLASCGNDSTSPGANQASISDAEAQVLGADVAGDLSELMENSVFDAANGIVLMSPPRVDRASPPLACVTITPFPPPNSDGDIVPDSARFDYSACVFTRAGGQLKDSLSGTIDFIDPLPLTTSIGVRKVFTDFTRVHTNVPFPNRSYIAVHNGTREWGGNADTLGHTVTNFVTTWTHTATGRMTTHTKDWTAKFTADQPGSIVFGAALPAGNWNLAGTGTWVSGPRQWSLSVDTPTPLHHDPGCDLRPTLDAGVLHLAVTRNGITTDVTIQFTACGQFTVTRMLTV